MLLFVIPFFPLAKIMQVCLRRCGHHVVRQLPRIRCLSAVPAPVTDTISGPSVPEHVLAIADQICKLSLLETSQLTSLLKDKLGKLKCMV